MAFIKAKEVLERSGYSRTQIWRKSRNPNDPFPAPYQIGDNRIAWDAQEYEAWEKSRKRVNYAPAKSDKAA